MSVKEMVTNTVEFLRGRKRNFQLCFGSPAGQMVLIDLAHFCRANETCVVPEDYKMSLVLEGRREVWLRIQQHMNLSPEQLFNLYSGKPNLQPDKDEDNG